MICRDISALKTIVLCRQGVSLFNEVETEVYIILVIKMKTSVFENTTVFKKLITSYFFEKLRWFFFLSK